MGMRTLLVVRSTASNEKGSPMITTSLIVAHPSRSKAEMETDPLLSGTLLSPFSHPHSAARPEITSHIQWERRVNNRF